MEEKMTFEELQQMLSICIDEVIRLKQENEQLWQQSKKMDKLVESLISNQKELTTNISHCLKSVVACKKYCDSETENIRYELQDIEITGKDYYKINFYDYETTIREIVENRKSLVRFGDGEFELMAGKMRYKFQHYDESLAERLKKIIGATDEGLLVAIADNYGSLDKYTKEAKRGIREYMTREVRMEHREHLDLGRTYHNAYISRPYVMFNDNHTEAPKLRFEQIRRIWNMRKVIFIEGVLTRLGVGNDLFDNAADIRRIEAPATNSFERYADILQAAIRHADKDVLFLVALGPTAEPLVYDLYKAGYQAVDIGHLDLEYEWFLNGSGGRSEVRTKYNNEWSGGDCVEDIDDENYRSQIIEKIY